jgi:hypothetical protein
MRRLIVPLVCVTFLLLAVPGFANDLPGSSDIGAFTFDLYESVDGTPTGAFSETGPILTLPENVVAGTIRVWEGPSGDQSVLSDKVFIYPLQGSTVGNTIQLFSDDPSRPFPEDLAGLSTADVYEGDFTTLPIIYTGVPGPNIYQIWSDLPSDEFDVPLPPSLILLGSGLLSLVGWRRFRIG